MKIRVIAIETLVNMALKSAHEARDEAVNGCYKCAYFDLGCASTFADVILNTYGVDMYEMCHYASLVNETISILNNREETE